MSLEAPQPKRMITVLANQSGDDVVTRFVLVSCFRHRFQAMQMRGLLSAADCDEDTKSAPLLATAKLRDVHPVQWLRRKITAN